MSIIGKLGSSPHLTLLSSSTSAQSPRLPVFKAAVALACGQSCDLSLTAELSRDMLDVLFVGAGPHSLATLTRLLEPNPDPSVDAPQRRVTPKNKVLSYWQWQRTCPTYRSALKSWLNNHVAVVDPAGRWMDRWQQQFTALGISHLRSTTAVHPDPLDGFALATFASSTGRTGELMPLQHIEKSTQFAGPFAVPSAALFEAYCQDLVQRYCLEDCVIQDKVTGLTPTFNTQQAARQDVSTDSADGRVVDHWLVQLESGRQLQARRVVLGIGSTNKTRVPDAFQGLQPVPEPINASNYVISSTTTSSNSNSSSVGKVAAQAYAKPSNNSSSSDSDSSECCSGCCDGACSSSSGWGSDSSSSSSAVTLPPQCLKPVRVPPTKQPNCSTAPAPAAAAAPHSCSSSASSPRSSSSSPKIWLDHQAPTAGGTPEISGPSQQASETTLTAALAAVTGRDPGACRGPIKISFTAAAGLSSTAAATAAASGTDVEGEACSGVQHGEVHQTASTACTLQAARYSVSLEPAVLASGDSPGCGAGWEEEVGGVSNEVHAAAATAAAYPGPCSWVNSGGCSSPTGSACDSLCSWLGCEHTAAAAAMTQQQQQHLITVGNLSFSGVELRTAAGPPLGCVLPALGEGAAGCVNAEGSQPTTRLTVAHSSSSSSSSSSSDQQLQDQVPQHSTVLDTAAAPTAGTSDTPSSQSGTAAEAPPAAAAAAAVSEQNGAHEPQAGPHSYPWGRLLHAWQLVKAVASGDAAAQAGSPGGTTTAQGTSASDNSASSSSSGKLKAKKRQASSSSKAQKTSKDSSRSAVSSAASLLQQQGLVRPGERVVIVGGGLTSAHLAALAAAATAAANPNSNSLTSSSSTRKMISEPQTGSSCQQQAPTPAELSAAPSNGVGLSSVTDKGVTLLLRGPLRVKQFDVDVCWMGRNRGATLQFGFRQLSDAQERLLLMRRALQGGSITPEASAVLDKLQCQGVLEVVQHAGVLDAAWDWQQQHWNLWLEDGRLLHPHRLWLATGSALSAPEDPLLSGLLQQLPVPVVGGLPVLQPTLECALGTGLYVLGAYAALQLGPGALNLAGAKTASVIVEQQLKPQLAALPAVVDVGGSGGMLSAGKVLRQQGRHCRAVQG